MTETKELRAESHHAIGVVIQRDTGVLIDRWVLRARAEQPNARRVHHDVLLDHLPALLWELGRSLAQAGTDDAQHHCRPAGIHGDQRWDAGWSIAEVVRDYQLLRVVVVEYLEEVLHRPLTYREVMALGVFIDDAIGASVTAYVSCQAGSPVPGPDARAQGVTPEGLLGVLGFLGHELRNPLAPLNNALQVLRIAGADPARVEKVRLLMERQLRVLARLVDDLLDVPRLARGKMSILRERIDLARLVRECVGDRKGAFDEAGVALVADLPGGPAWTTGDRTRLTQAVGNLLANALKFTDRGGTVTVRLTADPGRRAATLTVADTGVGIDPQFLPKVFEAFMQADRSLERTRGGLGLGLALVKGIVELHGGSVRAASAGTGRGTEFAVELPLLDLVPAAPEAGTPAATRTRPKRVLVIEDDRDSAESLKMYLELLGHAVLVAHTGTDGLAAAGSWCPDVVVCDLGLPGMSGHTVCQELRKAPEFAAALIVALSGHGTDEDHDACKCSGFDHHLLKPVDPQRVAALISGAAPQ